ncbi:gluconokinase [Burkholderia sp. BCC1977]|uniref:gluconokinase n=1 Tax=Burkholderia sp. BCC1977 TaxID=2817440 RepID=UPI002ABE96B8|nr:gluconokinase [Burkholderia sp. BCC1977]
MILIVMGVSGAGKSHIGEMLAKRLSCNYTDGDAFHSSTNKTKMHQGTPLTDEDRWPWLRSIRTEIENAQRTGNTAVFTCSSLKRSYREVLRRDNPDIRFVYLKGSVEVLRSRLNARCGHFFDSSLLESQLSTLEDPGPQEAIAVNIDLTPDQIVNYVLRDIVAHPHNTAI